MHVVPAGKAPEAAIFVLPHAGDQVAGDANIKCPVSSIGHDVNTRLFHIRSLFLQSLAYLKRGVNRVFVDGFVLQVVALASVRYTAIDGWLLWIACAVYRSLRASR
jgi:hypothetical protein